MNSTPIVKFAGLERGRNGKLACKFDIYGGPGMLTDGMLMMTTTSAPIFQSYGAAFKGARRALAAVVRTGKFPNMCKGF